MSNQHHKAAESSVLESRLSELSLKLNRNVDFAPDAVGPWTKFTDKIRNFVDLGPGAIEILGSEELCPRIAGVIGAYNLLRISFYAGEGKSAEQGDITDFLRRRERTIDYGVRALSRLDEAVDSLKQDNPDISSQISDGVEEVRVLAKEVFAKLCLALNSQIKQEKS